MHEGTALLDSPPGIRVLLMERRIFWSVSHWQAKSDMIYLLAHSGNITMLTFCQALFEIDLW